VRRRGPGSRALCGAGYPFELLAGKPRGQRRQRQQQRLLGMPPQPAVRRGGTYGRQYYVDVPQTNPLVRHVMISPGILYPDGIWS